MSNLGDSLIYIFKSMSSTFPFLFCASIQLTTAGGATMIFGSEEKQPSGILARLRAFVSAGGKKRISRRFHVKRSGYSYYTLVTADRWNFTFLPFRESRFISVSSLCQRSASGFSIKFVSMKTLLQSALALLLLNHQAQIYVSIFVSTKRDCIYLYVWQRRISAEETS